MAGAFLATAFFLAGAFLATAFFLAGAFLATAFFLAGAFLATAFFLAGAFLATAFFLAGAFLATAFFLAFLAALFWLAVFSTGHDNELPRNASGYRLLGPIGHGKLSDFFRPCYR